MYACSIAINISNATTNPANTRGISPPNSPKATTNPAMLFSIMCPTVMFATSHTVRLNGFDNNDIISIGIIRGAIIHGIPAGKNVRK